jgi:uncharacterized membrane protein
MTLSSQEKLFKLFVCTIFISRNSSSSSSNSSSNSVVIFAAAVSIIIVLQVFYYKRHIFVHLLLSCTDSVTGSCRS